MRYDPQCLSFIPILFARVARFSLDPIQPETPVSYISQLDYLSKANEKNLESHFPEIFNLD